MFLFHYWQPAGGSLEDNLETQPILPRAEPGPDLSADGDSHPREDPFMLQSPAPTSAVEEEEKEEEEEEEEEKPPKVGPGQNM